MMHYCNVFVCAILVLKTGAGRNFDLSHDHVASANFHGVFVRLKMVGKQQLGTVIVARDRMKDPRCADKLQQSGADGVVAYYFA